MERTEQNIQAFKHARWEVTSTRQLLVLHELARKAGNQDDWDVQKIKLERRLELARRELARFPEAWDPA